MALKIIRGATFRSLERRLLQDLQDGTAAIPPPLWVITPTAAVANHLRLRLIENAAEGVSAGIRVIPLTHFLKRLSQAAQLDAGERRGPLLDLLLHQLTRRADGLQIVRHLAEIPGGGRFLMPTFLDLGDGGFGPAQQELMLELAAQPDLSAVESEVLRLYCLWLELLERTGVRWAPLQGQKLCQALEGLADEELLAALACEPAQTPRLHFHGFYEFTDVNTQLLAALSRRLETRLYYPFAPGTARRKGHPAFAFALPILEDIEFRLGAALESVEDLGSPQEASAEFLLHHFPEGAPSLQPEFLSCQKASGIRAEAVSAALRIRRWLDEDSCLTPSDILVTVSTIAPYVAAMREVFREFALPLRILEAPGGLDTRHKALRSLGRIWQEDAASEWLLPHLRDFRPSEPIWAGFEEKVRSQGIWGGDAWRRALQADSQSKGQSWSEAQRRGLDQIVRVAEECGGRRRADLDPRQALQLLEGLAFLLPEGKDLLMLRQAVETLDSCLPDLVVPKQWLQDCLLESGSEQPKSDTWNRSGVLFAPVMRSRGLTARRLVVLGLSCGRLPLRIEEDPLLSDRSRRRLAALARDLGHRIPVKTRAAEEQALLFFLLNTSAEQVHWVIPESDETGRRVAPTPWVQRFLNHWQADGPPQAAPLQRGPRRQAADLLAADPGTGRFLPPAFAQLLGLEVLPAAARRRSRPRLTRFPPSLSVTALEALARCPFRFHARHIARWSPLEPLLPFRTPAAMQRGRLLHSALERLLADFLEQGATLSAASRELLREGGRKLREGVRQAVEETFSRQAFPHRLLQEAAIESLIRTLSAYFEQAAREEVVHPEALESECRRRLPQAKGVTVRGKIDRVDRQDFGTCRVIDYKSGKKPAQLDAEVRAGFRLQPSLYPWLYQTREASSGTGGEAAFAYVFLSGDPPATYPQDEAPPAEQMLASLAELLLQGDCFPTSNQAWQRLELPLQPCRGCGLASLCRRHDPGHSRQFASLFRKKGKARLDYLRDQLL